MVMLYLVHKWLGWFRIGYLLPPCVHLYIIHAASCLHRLHTISVHDMWRGIDFCQALWKNRQLVPYRAQHDG